MGAGERPKRNNSLNMKVVNFEGQVTGKGDRMRYIPSWIAQFSGQAGGVIAQAGDAQVQELATQASRGLED